MSERSFAGFTYRERLGGGFYGELYKATATDASEAHLLQVDPRLARAEGFAEALLDHGSRLLVDHPGVVATRSVGHGAGGALVVVTDPTPARVSLADVLARGVPIEPDLAVAIVLGALEGLAAIHRAGAVHGAVHPRSVLIGFDGRVVIADVAVGRALAIAAAESIDAPLLEGFTGYVAPELALGDEPTPLGDVYAAGAILFSMLAGAPPPGTADTTPAVERVIQRALDTDLTRRYRDAGELHENLREALEDDNWREVSALEVAQLVGDLGEDADVDLDAATEDLLSSIGDDDLAIPSEPAEAFARDARHHGDDDDDDLDGLLSDLEDPPTVVDPRVPRGHEETDPVSALIRLDEHAVRADDLSRLEKIQLEAGEPARDDETPLPPPRAAHETPGSVTLSGDDVLRGTGRRAVQEQEALDVIASLGDDDDPAAVTSGAEARAAAPELDLRPPTDTGLVMGRGRGVSWLWYVVAIGGIAALVWIVKNQATMMDKEEEAEAEIEAQNEAARRAHLADQPVPGTIEIDSVPEGAAVWMLVGRTPTTTRELSASMYHELRLELEGHDEVDVAVPATEWSGPTDARRATIAVDLAAGDKDLPAYPPEPPEGADDGFEEGKGVIEITSDPPGAQVWLLVGYTPGVQVTGERGAEYEVKIEKDGHVPGFVVVKASDWPAKGSGEGVHRSVELARKSGKGSE